MSSSTAPEELAAQIAAQHGITVKTIYRNVSPSKLYQLGIGCDDENEETCISSAGALIARSNKTGRSPLDKRIVDDRETRNDVWWSHVNIKLEEDSFLINKTRAIDYLNTRRCLFIVDGYAGWDEQYRIKIRLIASQAYHALFMYNMLIRPTKEQLETDFGSSVDYVIYNSGSFPANYCTKGMSSNTSVSLNLKSRELVILGTQYAGEMKKGVFTIMNYLMPKRNVLSMHSSCNEGPEKGDVTIFFGLSGTGKTTLSADPHRKLIGDDEHVWTEKGVFNIEGGCYAKCINLSKEKEPEIFNAIKFGTVLENVDFDPDTHVVDYNSSAITENTRACYPLEYIPNAKLPAMANVQPTNIIFLTCDAFGVLPPIAKLSIEQAMYHFINGYTSKVSGTEVGVKAPTATFSACFGEPFLVWHPFKYAEMLRQQLKKSNAHVWLINTGWIGGSAADKSVSRIPLKYTRAMIDAIHSGELLKMNKWQKMQLFDLQVPVQVPQVPDNILVPGKNWSDEGAYRAQLKYVANLFTKNFAKYKQDGGDKYKDAMTMASNGGPVVAA